MGEVKECERVDERLIENAIENVIELWRSLSLFLPIFFQAFGPGFTVWKRIDCKTLFSSLSSVPGLLSQFIYKKAALLHSRGAEQPGRLKGSPVLGFTQCRLLKQC